MKRIEYCDESGGRIEIPVEAVDNLVREFGSRGGFDEMDLFQQMQSVLVWFLKDILRAPKVDDKYIIHVRKED